MPVRERLYHVSSLVPWMSLLVSSLIEDAVVQPLAVRLAAGVEGDLADVGDEAVDLLVDRAAGAVVGAGGEVLDEVEEVGGEAAVIRLRRADHIASSTNRWAMPRRMMNR